MKKIFKILLLTFSTLALTSCSEDEASAPSNSFSIKGVGYRLTAEQGISFENQVVVGTSLIRTVFNVSGISNDGKLAVVSFDLYRNSNQSLNGVYTFSENTSSNGRTASIISSDATIYATDMSIEKIFTEPDPETTIQISSNGDGTYVVKFNANMKDFTVTNLEDLANLLVPIQMNVTGSTN